MIFCCDSTSSAGIMISANRSNWVSTYIPRDFLHSSANVAHSVAFSNSKLTTLYGTPLILATDACEVLGPADWRNVRNSSCAFNANGGLNIAVSGCGTCGETFAG